MPYIYVFRFNPRIYERHALLYGTQALAVHLALSHSHQSVPTESCPILLPARLTAFFFLYVDTVISLSYRTIANKRRAFASRKTRRPFTASKSRTFSIHGALGSRDGYIIYWMFSVSRNARTFNAAVSRYIAYNSNALSS